MRPFSLSWLFLAALVVPPPPAAAADGPAGAVVLTPGAGPLEALAGREVVRYVYLRTGAILPLVTADEPPATATIVVARRDRPLARAACGAAGKDALAGLKKEDYWLRTCERAGQPAVLLVTGGDDVGTLYAAYRLAEHLGVRFSLAGETVPDGRIPFALPRLDERAAPLFAVRGLQPFHDFYEGPDWWNATDYKLYLGQMAKLRMNFLGLHCYPDFGAGPELSVWIGPPGEVGEGTRVKASYPAFYANTLRRGWGMEPMKTGAYVAGAAQLFEQDGFGADVMLGRCPVPATPEDSNRAFDDAGRTLRDVFTHAHALGIQTCVGTEAPLTIPRAVRERLKAAGRNPADPDVIRSVYEGMFRRIMQAYPIDYYWLWTDEGWTWKTPEPRQVEAVTRDLRLAQEALANVKAPFTLATCGWVLGPPGDRMGFDRLLPKSSPMSCINRQVGHAPVEPAFARIQGRPLWAIPWLENDPNLTAPQLWVGRMRQDAADARRYGCTGLLGIHWRTAVLGPNIEALAQAAWSQAWPTAADRAPEDGAVGGSLASYPQNKIKGAGTEEPLYQSVRYGMEAYHLKVPNGVYALTLKTVELAYDKPGVRVFDATLQGRPIFERLDIFTRVGKNAVLDLTYPDVKVTQGRLDLEFNARSDYSVLAGLVVRGTTADGQPYTRKVKCGGPAWRDYEAEKAGAGAERRGVPSADFYRDWAVANFGRPAGEAIGAVFARIDGRDLPEPSGWVHGPGTVKVNPTPWEEEAKRYAFVGELEALRGRVQGAGNRARFDTWLAHLRGMRAMAEVGCAAGHLDRVMARVAGEKDLARQKVLVRDEALPVRLRLARLWADLLGEHIATVTSVGELGTIANLEQQSRGTAKLLTKHDAALQNALGEALPSGATPPAEYAGPPRLLVPTARPNLAAGEPLALRVLLPAAKPPRRAVLLWRPVGEKIHREVPLAHVARAVYRVEVPLPADVTLLEYHLKAEWDGGPVLTYPPTAPEVEQTVVVQPAVR